VGPGRARPRHADRAGSRRRGRRASGGGGRSGTWRGDPEALGRPFAGRTALLSPFDGSLRVDAIHEDTRFTQETTAAVEAEIEALASWLGLTVER